MMKILVCFLFFTFIFSSAECRHLLEDRRDDTFNVFDFGAFGDGQRDDSWAFKKTWKAACSSTSGSPTVLVPSGSTFLIRLFNFRGPCNSGTINVKIDGTLISRSNPSKWLCKNSNGCSQWIMFNGIDGLKVFGSGTINGQGSAWWDCVKKKRNNPKQVCRNRPTGFVISHCNNVQLSGLTFVDSPEKHIAFERSTGVTASKLTITAPGDSPNTDGIHIQNSQNVVITQSHIGTGDDCISIGDGSKYINISSITCGPGHGISVGSLGKHGKYDTVENVYVNDVEFSGTSNGVRIKTWQGGNGFARNIKFENIRSLGSRNPIIIDQFYCDHEICKNQTSAVQVSNITYSNVYGTSDSKIAVKFDCTEAVPCKDIYLNDINLQSTRDKSDTTSICSNVEGGRGSGNVYPRVPCLN